MSSVEQYQQQLLDQTRHVYSETLISSSTEQAYLACPRHEFVRHRVTLGMPSASSLSLKVYPRDVPLTAGMNEWLVRRSESQFLWSLPV